MKKLLAILLGLAVLLGATNANAKELTIEEAQDAVCRVTTTTRTSTFWGLGVAQQSQAMGTGTVYKEDATKYYIVTNGHVVGRAGGAVVEFFKGGYKSAAIPAKIEYVRFQSGTSLDMAILSIPKSVFANTVNKPRVIQFAPQAFALKAKDKIYGAGFPAGRWCQLWFARIYQDNGNTVTFNMPPEGGQSGTSILTTITDAKGEKHTAIAGILSWRYGDNKGNEWGGGVSLARAYEMFKENNPSADQIATHWECVAEVQSEHCKKCQKAPHEHYVIYNPNTNERGIGKDGKSLLYCDVNPAILRPGQTIITYRDFLRKNPGCDRPNNPQPPQGGGPPTQDGPPGGIWPDDLEPEPAPPAEDPDEPVPPVEAPKPDPRLLELENRIKSLNAQIKALEGSNTGLGAQLKVFQDQLAKLEAEKKALEDAKKTAENTAAETAKKLVETEAAKVAAEKAAAEKAAALAREAEVTKKISNDNERLAGEKAEVTKKLNSTAKELSSTATKVAEVEKTNTSLAEQLKGALGSKEELAKKLQELAEQNKDSLNQLNIPYVSKAFGGLGEFLSVIFGAIASGAVFTTIWHKFVYPQLVKRLGYFPAKIIGFIGKRKLRKYIEPEKKSSDETVGSGYNTNEGEDVIPDSKPAPELQPTSTIELAVPEAKKPTQAPQPVSQPVVTTNTSTTDNRSSSVTVINEAPKDHVIEFFEQNKNILVGMSVKEWAIKTGLYRTAVKLLGAGRLILSDGTVAANGPKASQAIEDYVTNRFLNEIQLTNLEVFGNIYHEAYLGYLYWLAVQKLSRGEFSVLGYKEAAEAVERYVKQEFMKKVRI